MVRICRTPSSSIALRIEYVENIPSASGGGVIQTTQARVFADDVKGAFNDLVVLSSPADMPTTFELEGRSSDGIVQISGRGAFFSRADETGAAAPLALKVYLDNLGMGAYGRSVSTMSLVRVRARCAARWTWCVLRNASVAARR